MEIEQELARRWRALRELARPRDLDAILVYFDEYNLADGFYFGDIWTQFERGFILVAVRDDRALLVLGPETERFARVHAPFIERRIVSLLIAPGASYPNTSSEQFGDVLKELVGRPPKRVGIVGTGAISIDLYTSVAAQVQELVDITADAQQLRRVKSQHEIECIRMAYRIADQGLSAIAGFLTPGITEVALAGAAENAMRRAGGEGYGYSTIVASGERTNSVFGRPTTTLLADPCLLMTGISPRYRAYCASLGLPFTIGSVSKETLDYIASVRQVYLAIEAALAPGMTSGELHDLSRCALSDHGLDDFQLYGAIHSIGLLEAEPPFLTAEPQWVLKPGMVLSIDLALFHPYLLGVRFESGYLVTQETAEPLSECFHTVPTSIMIHSVHKEKGNVH
jgi:Xaa-Pro aminopeptidase